MSDCKVCLVEHQADIHNATLSVRRWLKERIRRSLEPPTIQAPPPAEGTPAAESKLVKKGKGNDVAGAA